MMAPGRPSPGCCTWHSRLKAESSTAARKKNGFVDKLFERSLTGGKAKNLHQNSMCKKSMFIAMYTMSTVYVIQGVPLSAQPDNASGDIRSQAHGDGTEARVGFLPSSKQAKKKIGNNVDPIRKKTHMQEKLSFEDMIERPTLLIHRGGLRGTWSLSGAWSRRRLVRGWIRVSLHRA